MASHANTTTPLLRPEVTEPIGLLCTGQRRQPGPVTVAIQAMQAADPERVQLRALRQAIADRITADLDLLDALDGDPDFEPSLCGLSVSRPSQGGDDREHDEAERGIGYADGIAEQYPNSGYGRCA